MRATLVCAATRGNGAPALSRVRRFAGGPGQPGGSQKRRPNSAFGSTQPVLCSALPTLKSSPFYKNPSHTG